MVQINFAAREVNCKLVYYGPGRSGKTTNLEVVHAKAPEDSKGELVSIATETDRTLYFDFLPLELGEIANMATKFQLYTVPGQVFYNATRKLVLQGADGIIFVADSNPDMREENIESVENLVENLEENGLDIQTLPLVFQWNKRDLPGAMPTEQMNADLNRWDARTTEAISVKGEGVFPTLKTLVLLVIKKLNQEYAPTAGAPAGPAGAPAGPAGAPKAAAPPPPRPAPRPAAPPPRPAAPPRPAPRPVPPRPVAARPTTPAPRPAPAGGPGRSPARRTNPLAEEIRRRKEMEARRAGGGVAGRMAIRPPARKQGGANWPVVAGVVVGLVAVLYLVAHFVLGLI